MKDRLLTEHFGLYELTKTNLEPFQKKNRELTVYQIDTLTILARLLEHVRYVIGEPLIVLSGYRCPTLNRAIGSNSASQHLKCEAADFTINQDLGEAFRILWKDIKEKGTNVGQLIHETAKRPYGETSWIHISLGEPYRSADRCKQIARMQDGAYEALA